MLLIRFSSPRSTRFSYGWVQIGRGEGHLRLWDVVEIENREMEEDQDTKMLEETLVSIIPSLYPAPSLWL